MERMHRGIDCSRRIRLAGIPLIASLPIQSDQVVGGVVVTLLELSNVNEKIFGMIRFCDKANVCFREKNKPIDSKIKKSSGFSKPEP